MNPETCHITKSHHAVIVSIKNCVAEPKTMELKPFKYKNSDGLADCETAHIMESSILHKSGFY